MEKIQNIERIPSADLKIRKKQLEDEFQLIKDSVLKLGTYLKSISEEWVKCNNELRKRGNE